jgi:hypothetical protein
MNYKAELLALNTQLARNLSPYLAEPENVQKLSLPGALSAREYFMLFSYKLKFICHLRAEKIAQSEQKKYELSILLLTDTLRALYELKNDIPKSTLGYQPNIAKQQQKAISELLQPMQQLLEQCLSLGSNDISGVNGLWNTYKQRYQQPFQKIDTNASKLFYLKMSYEFQPKNKTNDKVKSMFDNHYPYFKPIDEPAICEQDPEKVNQCLALN